MKIIGVALVVCSSFFVGLELNSVQKKRINALSAFCSDLQLMQSLLSSSPRTVADLCKKVSELGSASSRGFFLAFAEGLDRLGNESAYEIWSQALEIHLNELNADDKNIIKMLGAMFGCYSLQEQIDAIKHCISELTQTLQEIRNRYIDNRRLYLGISLSAGTFLVLVLI